MPSKKNNTLIAAVGVATAAGVGAYYLSKQSGGSGLGSINFVPTTPTTIAPNGSVTFNLITKDTAGNPIGATLGIYQNGALLSNRTTSSIDGTDVFSLVFSGTGSFALQAKAGSVTSQTITVTVAVVPMLSSIVLASSGSNTITAGGSVTFTVSPLDQNLVGIAATGTINIGGSPVSGDNWTSTSTPVTVIVTFPSAGTFNVTAASGAIVSTPPITITVNPITPILTSITLSATSGTTINTGGSASFLATALDQSGNGMAGITVTVLDNGSQITGLSPAPTAANGQTTFSVNFPSTGSFGITVSSGSVVSNPPVTITVNQTIVTSILLTPTSSTTITVGGTVTASVQTTPGEVDNFTILVGTANSGTGVTSAAGQANISHVFNTAGTNIQLSVKDQFGVTSNILLINVGTTAGLTIATTSPATNITPGTEVQFAGSDFTFGAPIPIVGSQITLTQDAGTGTIGTATVTDLNGIWTGHAVFNLPGTHMIYAHDAQGNVSTVPATVTVAMITPVASVVLVTSDAAVALNAVDGLRAQVLDATNAPIQFALVHFLEGTTEVGAVLTDNLGYSRLNVIFTALGSYNMTAVAGGVTSNTKVVICEPPTLSVDVKTGTTGTVITGHGFGLQPSTSYTLNLYDSTGTLFTTIQTGVTDAAGVMHTATGASGWTYTITTSTPKGILPIRLFMPATATTAVLSNSFTVT